MARVLFDGLVEYEDGKEISLGFHVIHINFSRYSCYNLPDG